MLGALPHSRATALIDRVRTPILGLETLSDKLFVLLRNLAFFTLRMEILPVYAGILQVYAAILQMRGEILQVYVGILPPRVGILRLRTEVLSLRTEGL